MAAKRVIFEGRVQGVGFRYTTKDIARGFDVRGWVKNLPDGTVELQVDGDAAEVTAFLKEIAEESPVSHHIRAMHTELVAPLDHLIGFTIER